MSHLKLADEEPQPVESTTANLPDSRFGLPVNSPSTPLLQILSELTAQLEEANERLEEKVRRLYG